MSDHCPACGYVPEKPKGKPRSVPQNKRYHAMIRAAFSHWPEGHRFKPGTVERLRKWLQAKAGHAVIKTVHVTEMPTGKAVIAVAAEIARADPIHFVHATEHDFYVIESMSIDFDTLPHLAACALFDDVAQVIEAETGLKVDDIMPPIRGRDWPKLKRTPAAWRGISMEPLLGPIDIGSERPDWIITGGESGSVCRITRPEWVRSLRDQCAASGIAFHHKQWGGARPAENGCLLDGVEYKQFPAALAA